MCYLMSTFQCPSAILITSWLFPSWWSTRPGNHLVPCVAELVASCIPLHAHWCLPDPNCLFYPSGLSLCLCVHHFCLVPVDHMVLFHGMVCDGWLVSYTALPCAGRSGLCTSCENVYFFLVLLYWAKHLQEFWNLTTSSHLTILTERYATLWFIERKTSRMKKRPNWSIESVARTAPAHMLERQAENYVWGSRNTTNKCTLFTAGTQTRASMARESSVTHKLGITDHAVQNHVTDWDKVKLIVREAQRQTRWIKQAVWIRKTLMCMNRNARSYQLSHTWDQVISRSCAPSSCKQSRCDHDVRRTSKRCH